MDVYCRFGSVLDQLEKLERCMNLLHRYDGIQSRLVGLEQSQAALRSTCQESENPAPCTPPKPTLTPGASPIQNRLEQEMINKGFSTFRFVRAPADYYDQCLTELNAWSGFLDVTISMPQEEPLAFRQTCVGAASTAHLCKSMIMENTRAHPSVDGCSNPLNSKYYLVIVQYTSRLAPDKLKNFIHRLNEGKVAKQYFNLRLAPEDVSDSLSGFEHNAVTPVGMATRLPIIMSHKIMALEPDFFFLGGGEVDLKLGVSAAEFVQAYSCFVADCTSLEASGDSDTE